MSSHRATWTSLIIVVRLHAFKNGALLRSEKGQTGPLEHSRLGLVGWIAYWSLGNCALAVKIIVGLIRKLNLTERLRGTDTHSNEARGRDKRKNSHAHEGWSF